MQEASTTSEPAPKRKRGRENVRDMVLSLAVCVAVIVPVWYLGQPPTSDALKVVDPAADVVAFQQAAPGVPVPVGLPEGWRATSSTLADGRLRIGYVTPDEAYAEYAAQAGPVDTFVTDQTGRGTAGTTLTVGQRQFTIHSDADGHTSLVQEQPAGTVVLGGLRETAEDDELTELAASLR